MDRTTSTTNFSKISNCPECGSNDIILYYCGYGGDNTKTHYEITCNDCNFCVKDDTEENAITQWNQCAGDDKFYFL